MDNRDVLTKREEQLRKTLAALLNKNAYELSLTVSFGEQGVDSFVGLRFMREIQDLFAVETELEWLFDYPSIRQLSQFLDERFGRL